MFRASFVIVFILITLMVSFTNGKDRIRNRRGHVSATRKPVSIKLCGLALVRMLDMVCDRARELLMEKQRVSTHEKRQMYFDDDPFTRTLWYKDYAQFNNTLIGDCCLQACTLKTLLQYC